MKNLKPLFISIIISFCINEALAQCITPPAQGWNWAGPSVVSNSNRFFGTRNIAYDEFHNIYTVANLEGGSVTIGGFTVTALHGYDNVLIKQDQNGNVIWAKSFGSTQNDMENSVHKIVCDENGSLYISFNCTNLHINGVFQPGVNVNASHIIQFDYNGNYVADLYPAGGAGGISALEFYNGDLYFSDDNTIKKRNAFGIISTVVTLNNTSTIRIWNIKHAPNGDWIVNGYFTSPLSYDGVTLNEYTAPSVQSAEFIFRLNSSNQVVYALRMDGLADFYSGSLGIAFDNQSNLLFGGIPQGPLAVNQWRFQNTTMTLDYSANSAIVIKIDAASGNMLWNRQFRSQVSYTGNMLYLLCNPSNEILVVGSYTNGGVVPYAVCLPDYQNFILKLNANGEKIYFQNFGLGGGSFQSRMAITTWDYCKYIITGKGGDLYTVNNPNYNCLTFPNTGMYFTASFNDYSFEIDGNGIDDDCDGQIDEDNPNYQRWFQDVDGDGFGNTINSTFGCSAPAGYVGNSNDCNDNDPSVGYTHWYIDADGDGYGDANDPGIASCTPITGKISVHGDCNDGNATIYPGATEVCNGMDDNCDGIIDNFSGFATDGLIGHWIFDGDLNDQTINHNNGTGFGGISYTTGVGGKINGALVFDGVNDYVDIPHINAYNLGIGNFTLAYWFNTLSDIGSQVISKAPSGNGPSPYLGISSYSGSGNISARTQFQSSIDALVTGLNNAAWHQVVFSRNGNLLSLYVDGILKNAGSFTPDNISNLYKLVLGRNQDIYQYMYNGKLDNLRLYNRTLSSSEISSLFNYEQNGIIYPPPAEVCNGVDDNCDGQVDEGFVKNIYYADADGDGYGNLSVTIQSCIVPPGYVSNSADCNDDNAAINPGATEICNNIDDDCDGVIDESAAGGVIPVITASGSLIFCDGGSVTLTSSLGNSYLWSNGATTQSITVSESGSYTVTVTSVYGCSATSALVNTIKNPLPAVFNLTSTGGQCNSASPLSIGLSGSQAGVNYQLTINGNTAVGNTVTGTGLPISFGSPATAGVYSVIAKNVSTNCSAQMNGNIVVSSAGTLPALTATCTNDNPVLYFGFTLDQKATITVKPSGGTAPYKVSFTMNRPVNCNLINSSGDEIWMPGANTASNSYINCPASGSPLGNPVSTSASTITSVSGYQVSVTLMQDAIITATVTDANGCTYTCTNNIHAEDVRCFAGNSNIVKVTVCHKTGSIKNPCVKICIDQSAVQEHLSHGDFLGNCTPNCLPPIIARPSALETSSGVLQVSVSPNPTPTSFNVIVKGKDASLATLRVLDVYGRLIQLNQKLGTISTLRIGDKWPAGTYFIEVLQGGERRILKVIKAK